MLMSFIHLLLLLAGAFGVLLVVAVLLAMISGTSIALPGLGIIVSGGVLLAFGLLIIIGVVIGLKLLA